MKLIMTGRPAGAVLAMLAGVAVAYFSHVGGVTTPGETGIAGLGIAATATTRI